MYYITSSVIIIACITLVFLSLISEKKLSPKANKIISFITAPLFVFGIAGALYVFFLFRYQLNNAFALIGEDFASWADDTFYIIIKWETVLAAFVFAATSLYSVIRKKASVISGVLILITNILLLILAPVYSLMTDNKNADIKTYILAYTLFLCVALISENTVFFVKSYIKQRKLKK